MDYIPEGRTTIQFLPFQSCDVEKMSMNIV